MFLRKALFQSSTEYFLVTKVVICTVVRQQSAVRTELLCVENITYTKRRLFVSVQVLYAYQSIQNFRFHMPSKKPMVTQSSKSDDDIEGTLDLALICL